MGGGGSSSSQPTEQKVTQTQFPEEAKPYFTRLLKRAEAESLQPYSQYGGQRLAYFSPDELNAQAMTRGFAGAGSPREFDIAAQKASMDTILLQEAHNIKQVMLVLNFKVWDMNRILIVLCLLINKMLLM